MIITLAHAKPHEKTNFIIKFILVNFKPRFILTCCFESLRAYLITTTWNYWINLLLLLIPYHTQKANFIIQHILEIRLNQCFSSLWACSGIPDYTHLKSPTIICYFHGPLFTAKNSTSYLNLSVRCCSLKNPAFWLVLRFSEYSSKIRCCPDILFLLKGKIPLALLYRSKKAYLNYLNR